MHDIRLYSKGEWLLIKGFKGILQGEEGGGEGTDLCGHKDDLKHNLLVWILPPCTATQPYFVTPFKEMASFHAILRKRVCPWCCKNSNQTTGSQEWPESKV